MIVSSKKVLFYQKKYIFLPKEDYLDTNSCKKRTLFYIYGNEKPFNSESIIFCKKEYSWDTNLTTDESSLEHQNETTRNSVYRCEKEGVKVDFYSGDSITDEMLNNLYKCSSKMFRAKKIHSKIDIKLLKNLRNTNNLILTIASFGNKAFSYHIYLVDSENALLWHSCSKLYDSSQSRNFIGRINRYQHFADLKYFKNKRFAHYDWGGLTKIDPAFMNGIDKFKTSFPGKSKQYFVVIASSSKVLKFFFKRKFKQ